MRLDYVANIRDIWRQELAAEIC